MDTEIRGRAEPLLINGIPQPQLGGDPVVEPVQDGQVVATFGSGCQAEEFAGLDVVQQLAMGGAAA